MTLKPSTRIGRFGALALAAILTAGSSAAMAAPFLTSDAETALLAALDDEYQAEAFYAAVMDKFGTVRPFSNIIRAEQHHQSMVIDRLDLYGIEVPANPYSSGEKALMAVPETIAEACAIGVAAEVANRDLYDGNLLPKVEDYPDITYVFEALSAASEYQHLPAFQRCAR